MAIIWSAHRPERLETGRRDKYLGGHFSDLPCRHGSDRWTRERSRILGRRNAPRQIDRCSVERYHRSIAAVGLVAGLASSGIIVGSTLAFAALMQSHQRSSPSTPTAMVRQSISVPARNPLADRGAKLFSFNCAHCHGIDATGDEGPDLHGLTKSDARLESTILHGVKGEMPAFNKKLQEQDATALVAFLRTLR